ncbi:MAG: TonB-dependent receptor plug domain-containing protein [Flavobacteriales bacterium]
MKKIVACIIVFCCPHVCLTQADTLLSHIQPLLTDPHADAVEIVEFISHFNSANKRYLSLSGEAGVQHLDLGAWLDANGLAQVNRNGAPGASASLRFRGMASDHSSILWNGIPINSLSLGSSDLSLIPSFFFDKVALNTEPGANEFAATNLGAALNLSNVSADTAGFARLFTSFNSLLNQTYGVDVKIPAVQKSSYRGDEKFRDGSLSLRTKAFYQWYENNFSYTDAYQYQNPLVKQTHNDGRNVGFSQDVGWHWFLNELSANVWHQQRRVQLPLAGATAYSDAEQDDAFTRMSASLKAFRRNHEYHLAYAYNEEALKYRSDLLANGEWLIDSKTRSKSHFVNGHYLHQFREKFYMRGDAMTALHHVFNNNYEGGVASLSLLQVGASAIYHPGRHHAEIAMRHEVRNIKTQPSASLFYSMKVIEKSNHHKLTAEAMAARRFRAPDMNELYWQPGGNKNLLPEQGWNTNAALVFAWWMRSSELHLRVGGFFNHISNWIQWQPTSENYWAPVNYKEVKSGGGEAEVKWLQNLKRLKLEVLHRASHTTAMATNSGAWDDSSTFRMIYTPALVFFTQAQMSCKHFSAFASHKYTNLRYTDEVNNTARALPAYHFVVCGVNTTCQLSHHKITAGFSVDNVLNADYESVRGYAMPGRVYQLHLQFEFAHWAKHFSKSKSNNTSL